MPDIEYLTAESERGHEALADVMRRAYEFDLSEGPAEWTLVRLVDGEPVSFVQADPERHMSFPAGDLRYAFITNVATREDRRHEGHCRATMAEASARLRHAGVALAITHGRWALYKALGFSVFTYHSGVFADVELIRRTLGAGESAGADSCKIHDPRFVQPDLLVVSEVRARTAAGCVAALRLAADTAERMGKTRILFEEPPAPSYGSAYPAYATPHSLFATVAASIGARHIVQGGEPEGDSVPDADSIKVLDTEMLLSQALSVIEMEDDPPPGVVAFTNDAGEATLTCTPRDASVFPAVAPFAPVAAWPAAALAQLVTGYRGARLLDALHGSCLPSEALAMLEALFPPCWRFTRNESWTYTA